MWRTPVVVNWNPVPRTSVYNGQFGTSRRKVHIFFSKINLLSTDPYSCVPSDKLSYIVNPTLRTLCICVISMTEYLTRFRKPNANGECLLIGSVIWTSG